MTFKSSWSSEAKSAYRIGYQAAKEAATTQEPDWKAEYLQCVDGHNLTLDELRDAAAQIADLQNQYDLVTTELREKIAKLEARPIPIAVLDQIARQEEKIAELTKQRDEYNTARLALIAKCDDMWDEREKYRLLAVEGAAMSDTEILKAWAALQWRGTHHEIVAFVRSCGVPKP